MSDILDSEPIRASVYKNSPHISLIGFTVLLQRGVPVPDLTAGKYGSYRSPGDGAGDTVQGDRWNARSLEPGPAVYFPACRFPARPRLKASARTLHAVC